MCISSFSQIPEARLNSYSKRFRMVEKYKWNFRICFGATILAIVSINLESTGCLTALKRSKHMGKLIAYNFVTLNGFYKGDNEDISWHRHGAEESKYSEDMLAMDNILLFGRKTYEQMAGFWPTDAARELFPKVAAGMN